MGSAISIGTTGLSASSKQMDVIGNNLANSNTLGFKAGNTYFASMLNQSLSSSGSMAVGQGVIVAAIDTQFTQGSFETTGNATDLAIDGEGFFVVKDSDGASYYTRAGEFHINKEGLLADVNNYIVQGISVSQATGTDTGVEMTQDISFDNAMSNARATTEISVGANLDDNTEYGESFNVSQNVFDSRGQIHNLSITFLKTEGNGMWGFDAKLDGTNLSDATEQQASGLTFDKDGELLGMYQGSIPAAGAGAPAAAIGTGLTVGTIVGTTVTKPGQIFKNAAGISLTKEAPTGVWTVTNPAGYDNAVAWQEAEGSNNVLKVDMDGQGGADIVFDLGATSTMSTEVATMTFAGPLTAGDTITVAGRTFTATGAATAAQVATAFAGGAVVNGAMSGTLTGYTAAAGAPGVTVFTSTTPGANVGDLTAAVTGTAVAPGYAYVQGGSAVPNQWSAGNTVTFNVVKTDVPLTDVSLTFGPLSENLSGEASTIGLPTGTGATAQNKINWNLVGDGAKTITSYASSSVLKSLSDDGYTYGVLKNINVESDGIITGSFTNGQTSNLGQIVLASFPDSSGLRKIGNYFGATTSSGEAITNRAGSGGLGEIMNHSLEISNTDVAKEFINMITAQRAYQANSRVITTADQMLTELMNIKR
ncbi:MAG: flagellar hook-basal body complex protein [Deltaproteobacteria bacterium]|nr:flagellar hook-basal body complex protein [Deltaproteobacteria bacterium]